MCQIHQHESFFTVLSACRVEKDPWDLGVHLGLEDKLEQKERRVFKGFQENLVIRSFVCGCGWVGECAPACIHVCAVAVCIIRVLKQ